MRALALASLLGLVASSAHAQTTVEHALPIRYVERPLTVPQGTLRIDQALVLDTGGSRQLLNAPNALVAGVTDWLEIGFTWPYTRDPGLQATLRIAHSDVIDAGVRVQVTLPVITNGDTDLAVSLPIVLRLGHWVRIATGVTGEFLLAQQMQPLIRVPLQIAFQATRRMFFALQGSASLVDRRWWHGDVGFVFGHTAAATRVRPIGEVRIGASILFAPTGGGSSATGFEATLAFSFFPTFMPTRW